MGIVGLGLSTMTVEGMNGAVFQMFAHGIMTALLFSSLGYIYDRTHTKLINELGGISRIMPVASGFFIFGALAGMGIPGLATFWAEFTVLLSSLRTYPALGATAVAALVISALFMLRVIQKTFYGPRNERFSAVGDIPLGLGIPRIILAAVILLFGMFPSLMLDLIQTSSLPLIRGLP
jgi:NADH-quinone oxidoreductase subunit M